MADPRRRERAEEVLELMRPSTGAEPVAWGTMIGFGRQPYTTADGKRREWFAVGLAPRVLGGEPPGRVTPLPAADRPVAGLASPA